MDFKDVEKLILLMKQHELTQLDLKEGDWQFSAKRGGEAAAQPQYIVSAPAPHPMPAAASTAGAPAAAAPAAETGKNLKEITAPIVGTFYRAPAPDQPHFKEVGDRVDAEDIVCIVEAMKVMNEIKSGVSGTIKKILVENASPVEYGQPLFLVEVG
ncbi:MAG TPA: acetyl-CoA carboxylase biotin carboxyl carrier protein [Planctomycetota bacterium]|nr:acetyl-CoA carboxylase biotin carboxyl carrier protein [Planctomycetota bacterium]